MNYLAAFSKLLCSKSKCNSVQLELVSRCFVLFCGVVVGFVGHFVRHKGVMSSRPGEGSLVAGEAVGVAAFSEGRAEGRAPPGTSVSGTSDSASVSTSAAPSAAPIYPMRSRGLLGHSSNIGAVIREDEVEEEGLEDTALNATLDTERNSIGSNGSKSSNGVFSMKIDMKDKDTTGMDEVVEVRYGTALAP